MFKSIRNFRFSSLLLAAAVLVLVTSACGFQTSHPSEITQVVDLNLNEELFSQSAPSFTVDGHDFWEGLLVDVNHLELHDGYLRFVGTRVLPDGSRVPGSIDLSLAAEKGGLTAKIIAVDIPGIKFTDPVIVKINQDIEAELTSMDFELGAVVRFERVQVTEDALLMKVRVTVRI
jgi:hypothetical protein